MLKGKNTKAPTFTDWLLLQVALFSIYLIMTIGFPGSLDSSNNTRL